MVSNLNDPLRKVNFIYIITALKGPKAVQKREWWVIIIPFHVKKKLKSNEKSATKSGTMPLGIWGCALTLLHEGVHECDKGIEPCGCGLFANILAEIAIKTDMTVCSKSIHVD